MWHAGWWLLAELVSAHRVAMEPPCCALYFCKALTKLQWHQFLSSTNDNEFNSTITGGYLSLSIIFTKTTFIDFNFNPFPPMSANGTYRFHSVSRQTILLVNGEPLRVERVILNRCCCSSSPIRLLRITLLWCIFWSLFGHHFGFSNCSVLFSSTHWWRTNRCNLSCHHICSTLKQVKPVR